MRREGAKEVREKKNKKEENDGSEEGSKRVENLGWRKESSKVWEEDQEIGISKVPQVDPYLQKESKWGNVDEEDVGSYNRSDERTCTEKKKNLSLI